MTKFFFNTHMSPTDKLSSPLEPPSAPSAIHLSMFPYSDATQEDETFAKEEDCSEISPSTHKWISLFRDNSDSDATSECDNIKSLSSESSLEEEDSGYLEKSNNALGNSDTSHCWEDGTPPLNASPSCLEEKTGVSDTSYCLENGTWLSGVIACVEKETGHAGANPCWDEETSISETQADTLKKGEEYDYSKPIQFTFERENLNLEKDTENTSILPGVHSSHVADKHSTVARLTTGKFKNASINSAEIQSVIDQEDHDILVEESSHSLHLSDSHVHTVSSPSSKLWNVPCSNKQLAESLDKTLSGADRRIFVMGGYDGVSWLPTMECYVPSQDIVKSLKPMSSKRSNGAAIVLDGHIYNVGGWNGYNGLWYNTVKCYSLSRKEWIACPPLKEKKGFLASAALKDKIFAIGGGNGVDCFRAVEMFEPVLGKWIPAQSMLQKRFSSDAAELDGVLYVVGGYDGTNYLKSAERFDPREFSWSKLPSLCTGRASHALTVFQGKLYALGGHDETNYLPSVEIFDPRKGSWVPGDDMKVARGHFFATVIGDAMYAIGGQTEGNYILDSVETYGLGHGWSVTKLKGIGPRCLFSAVVY